MPLDLADYEKTHPASPEADQLALETFKATVAPELARLVGAQVAQIARMAGIQAGIARLYPTLTLKQLRRLYRIGGEPPCR